MVGTTPRATVQGKREDHAACAYAYKQAPTQHAYYTPYQMRQATTFATAHPAPPASVPQAEVTPNNPHPLPVHPTATPAGPGRSA